MFLKCVISRYGDNSFVRAGERERERESGRERERERERAGERERERESGRERQRERERNGERVATERPTTHSIPDTPRLVRYACVCV